MITRFVQVLLLAAAVVMVVPPLRRAATPHAGFVLNPIYRVTTGDRVERIALYMERELRSTGRMPGPRDLPNTLRSMFPNRTHAQVDAWGRHFYFRRTRDGYRIGSMGPDGIRGNNDDVLSKVHGFPQRPDYAPGGS